jgi:GNAT superfamily N-acetyltransferase
MDASGCLIVLRGAVAADAAACAAIINGWVDATPWMPRVHSAKEIERRFGSHVMAVCRVCVAEVDAAVAGFVAVDGEGFVAGLFVAEAARGRGIGTALIEAAKAARPEGLTLWTFVANTGARRFYAGRGFVEEGGTDGENDEGLPDLRLDWRAPA